MQTKKAFKASTMKPKNIARKSNKKKLGRFSPLGINPLRALMFIMSFAILGSWYLIATHAASGYGVRFVFVCSSNACSGSEGELRGYAGEIQGWYQGQVGRTFQNLGTTSYRSPHSSNYFYGGAYNSDNTYYNLYDELNSVGLIESNVKTVVMLGFRSMSNCGVAAHGGNLAITDPFKGCGNIKSAVLAHELGHSFGFVGTNSDGMHDSDGMLMHAPLACNGAALGNCSLNQRDRSFASTNGWFQPPAPKSTIQGYKVVGTGSGKTAAGVPAAQVVYTCCNIAGNPNYQGGNPYFFREVDRALHRVAITGLQAGWEVIGATVCYDRTDCHDGTPTPLGANPDAGPYQGLPSIVVDSRNAGFVDLWFHFRPITSQPQADDTSLTINIKGASNTILMRSVTSSDGARHTVGRCTELEGGYAFNVTNTRTCTGERIGPVAITAPASSGPYSFSWSGCSGGASGYTCYINRYDSGSQTITATYTPTSTTSTPPPAGASVIGRASLVGVGSNRCIDVPGQNFNTGVQIQLWDCNGTIAQIWTYYSDQTLRTTTGLCLDVPGSQFVNGAKIQLWTCNGTGAQKWTAPGDGTIRTSNNKCLDAEGGGTGNGTKIIIWDCHGGSNQRWGTR